MSVNTLVFEHTTTIPRRYVSVNMPDHAVMARDRFASLAFVDCVRVTYSLVEFDLDDGHWIYAIDNSRSTERFIHLKLLSSELKGPEGDNA